MKYFVKTPWWLKRLYGSYTWNRAANEKTVYLTFDDGPHPVATPFVLDELKKHNAKATFFCIGKNVIEHPRIYERVIAEGHRAGNHTQNHLNGWKTADSVYLHDVIEAENHIDSNLFRPPYGKIKRKQASGVKAALKKDNVKIVMWDILSGDFDLSITNERCLNNVIKHSKNGSIIVFHDSEKAFDHLKYVLPATLNFFAENGYKLEKL